MKILVRFLYFRAINGAICSSYIESVAFARCQHCSEQRFEISELVVCVLDVCRQSYDVDIEVGVAGSGVTSSNTLDLKNPCFRYTGQPVQAPPGTNYTSPTDAYWASLQDGTGNKLYFSVCRALTRLM